MKRAEGRWSKRRGGGRDERKLPSFNPLFAELAFGKPLSHDSRE